MIEQSVPPESYYFKELQFDGIGLMVVGTVRITCCADVKRNEDEAIL